MVKTPLLELRSVTKTFPGTRALDRVNLCVYPGEVVALLGENGAGKSTLMKVLSGVWPTGTFEGEILVKGKPARFRDTRDAHSAGIAMIHQELSVFPELTVAEHLELDQLPTWIKWNELHARTQRFLNALDLDLQSTTRVGDLSVGGRQLVEIARALYRKARVLIFDEPTSALTDQEVTRLYQIIDRLRAEGHAIVYITHRMDEVFRLADRMVVLRDGQNVGELDSSKAGARLTRKELEPQLITWMVGRAIEDVYPPKNSKLGKELLRVENLSVLSPKGVLLVNHVSFTLREGEVLGLAGLLGAGRSETFQALFGVLNSSGPNFTGMRVEGRVWIKGQEKKIRRPSDAIRARMAFVSEDRKGSGLVINQSIRSNITLPIMGKNMGLAGPLAFIDEGREREDTQRLASNLRIKSYDLDQSVGELSGGNQQKVVLAKWLLTDPEILFLDEPTRGIDVGAKVEIYHLIQKLAAQGLGILMASSEMPEVLGLSHRILVLREGLVSAELIASQANQEDIMRAASL